MENSSTDRPPLPCHPARQCIALIGARGSGKSSVGRAMASLLGWDFADADLVLEDKAGCSIKDIFAAEGEMGFRDRESTVLAELVQRPRLVIASGGGVIVRPLNRRLLRDHVWAVWLTADAATLSQRLSQDVSTRQRRPALTGAGAAHTLEEVSAVLRDREPLYRACADAIVSTQDRGLEQIIHEIVELWHLYQARGLVSPPSIV